MVSASITDAKTKSTFARMFPVPQWLNPFSVALDISQSSIKYLSLKRDTRGVFPDIFFQTAIPEGVIQGGEIVRPDELVRVLKGISTRFGNSTAYVALPEEFAYIFPITVLNAHNDEQVRTAVEFSLSEHVPLPMGQIVYDWAEIPSDDVNKSHFCSVTGYDVRKSEQYRDVLEKAGFTVYAFESEVHAAARACIPTGSSESGLILLIDIGKTRTGVTAVWNGVPIATTTIDHGGSSITAIFSELASGDLQKAEELKQEHGLFVSQLHPEVTEKIEICMQSWLEKVTNYVTYLSETHAEAEVPLPKINRVIMCGGEVAVPGLLPWVASHLPLPVSAADVWQNLFSYDDFIPEIERTVSYRLATTVGLALRNLEQ